MRKLVRILKWSGLLLVVAILCLFVAGSILYNKKYDAPIPDLHASKDSLVISKGKHLVFTTAHCVECHFKPGDSLKVVSGEEVDMAGGGFPFKFPGGVFYASNISSDKETGIGNYTDGEIARMLRYGIKRDGSVLIPAMEYHPFESRRTPRQIIVMPRRGQCNENSPSRHLSDNVTQISRSAPKEKHPGPKARGA